MTWIPHARLALPVLGPLTAGLLCILLSAVLGLEHAVSARHWIGFSCVDKSGAMGFVFTPAPLFCLSPTFAGDRGRGDTS